jgi:hypothetical protein
MPVPPLPVLSSADQFAWRVAARIDFIVNLLLNGAIAWWFYGAAPRVALAGPGSMESMLVPMAFFLCAITTVFGWWNAVRERRAGRVTPGLADAAGWFGRALVDGVAAGAISVATMWMALRVVDRTIPAAALPGSAAVAAIALAAGGLGYLFHGRAVVRGGRWRAAPA